MEWIAIAKALPTGQKTRTDCPNCGAGTNTNAAIVNHNIKYYSLYCNACGHNPVEQKGIQTLEELARIEELNTEASKSSFLQDGKIILPKDITDDIPIEGRLWLYQGGISPTTWKKYGIKYSPSLQRVILPVESNNEVVWFQGRAIHKGQKPKYLQPSHDKGDTLFAVQDRQSETAVITEDILSAIRVGKCVDAFSILGTKISTGQAFKLSKYKKVYTWLDNDKAGKEGAYNIRRALHLLTDVGNITSDVDPKNLSNKEIEEILHDKRIKS